MRIVSKALDNSYEVLCENCGARFESRAVGLYFECPSCGNRAMAADLISYWMLETEQRVLHGTSAARSAYKPPSA